MPKEQSPGKPTGRRYSPEEKAGAVRMVRTLRAELGTEHGTVQRVARQLEHWQVDYTGNPPQAGGTPSPVLP